MTLSNREKIIALIANGITIFSMYQKIGDLPPNTNLYDFVLKIIPEESKPELSAKLIDDIFQYVSNTHSS